MPTVGVNAEQLFKVLGKRYTEKEFADLCFDYGLELDEVTSEKKQLTKEQGANAVSDSVSDDVIYKIDIPANRYDLLCIEGIARALLIFQGKIPVPKFEMHKPKKPVKIQITKATEGVRSVFLGAILRNVTFTKEIYNSFIDLQDKLHQNIGRKRQLVSIGTHDLDTVKGPFKYDALPPNRIKFVPLNQKKEFTAKELMELYSKDSHLKAYLPIIQGSPVYPVVLDSNHVVCSMPPIINSEHSKIKLETKNIFIDITATDAFKASIVLDTIVAMFSEYCDKKFHVEQVSIIKPDGSSQLYPKLPYRHVMVKNSLVNETLGIDLEASEAAELLTKMSLSTEVVDGDLQVLVPPTRHDVLHPIDIVEDVGIAYGYNNIKMSMPNVATVATQLPVNKLTDALRHGIAESGYTEAFTFSLCSKDDISTKLRKPDGCEIAVKIANPKSLDFQVVRTSLLPGLLKTVSSNRKMPLPMKLFEVSDIVIKAADSDVGAKNQRYLAAVNYGKTSGFEFIHGLLDRTMVLLDIPHKSKGAKGPSYEIRKLDDETYLPGRSAEVIYDGKRIGMVGVIHPDVLTSFDLHLPVAALEICIEPFV